MVEDWQSWAVPGAAWLLTYLIHSTLLIAAVWLISRRLEGRPAALDALWKAALAGGLVTATLQTAAGVSPWGGRLDLVARDRAAAQPAAEPEAQASSRFELWAPPSAHERRARPHAAGEARGAQAGALPGAMAPLSGELRRGAAGVDAPAAGALAVETGRGADAANARRGDAAAVGAGAVARPAPAEAAAPRAGAGRRVWLAAAFLAWAVLAGLLGFGLIRSWVRLRRLLADRRPIEAGPASAMVARLAGGSRRRARLSASARIDVPIAVGVFRPEIVVPDRALCELEPAELESLLAHELAHLVRRDPAWRLVAGFMQRVLFVQPLNRTAAQQLESASEVLCDDWAVERTRRPLALARCLTEVAGWVASPLGASVPAMARRGSGLGRRVRRLVAAGEVGVGSRRDRWPVPLAAGCLALVVFAAPGAGETGSPSPPTAMPPAPAPVTPAADDAAPASRADRSSRGDARRLLDQLRAGRAGKHDVADWVALAQLLGSPDHGGLDPLRASGDDDDEDDDDEDSDDQDSDDQDSDDDVGSAPLASKGDLADLISGALSQALGGLDIDVDIDIQPEIDIDLDLGGGHEGDEDGRDLDLRFDFHGPGADAPDPPHAPHGDCDDDDDDDDDEGDEDHGDHDHRRQSMRDAAREIRRHALEAARMAREQALREAHRARDEAHRQARQAREQALWHARRARDEAHRQAREVQEQARRIREQVREQLREQARALHEAAEERQRELQHMRHEVEQRQRELEQRDRERQQRDRERQQRDRERQQDQL